jgi:large subunit ribosomal protein L24e
LIFANAKSRKLYLRKKNPRVIRWTVTYRRLNKKMANVDQIKKRARKAKKSVRPIVGADLETIRQKKAQRETIRIASKEAALKELEERKKKRAEAKAKAAAAPKPQAPKQKMPKNISKKGGR